MDVKPEEIKRQAIAFAKYYYEYKELCLAQYLKAETVEEKSEDKLYEEFTEGKPVSL